MARTDFFEDSLKLTVDEIRNELQGQEKRYRKRQSQHVGCGYKAESEADAELEAYCRQKAEYYKGKADGICEALKAYQERGL